jgi:hypothetical protein
MAKLGIPAEHFPEIQAEYDSGKFQAKDKGTGKLVREYLRQNVNGVLGSAGKSPESGHWAARVI